MERKIGEIFEYNGEWYQCIEDKSCGQCDLSNFCLYNRDLGDNVGDCSKNNRSDGESICFKKLEKVGEPYMLEDKKFQKYKVFKSTYIYHKIDCSWQSFSDPYYVSLEIKEDMEEKKLNLKPFDIQKAREGKPVCTRDGHKARIICFDRVTNSTNEYTRSLVVLITNPNGDEQSWYYTDKGVLIGNDEYDNYDLMMLPEKKEGWVNVVKEPLGDDEVVLGYIFNSYEDAVRSGKANERYVATVRIEWEG